MAARLSSNNWVRILLPALIILLWLGAAGLGGPKFGQIDEVSSNDPAAYLPSSADATLVQSAQRQFTDSDSIPAIVVFTSTAELTQQQLSELGTALENAISGAGLEGASSPLIPSEDGLAAQAFVPIPADEDIGEIAGTLSSELRASAPSGIESFVTGPAGFSADLIEAFSGIDSLLLIVALLAVLVILLFVYRSLLLPFIVLATSLFALCTALLIVWWLAKSGALLLSGQTQGILFILVIGAATDYCLLLVARFREELRHTADPKIAVRAAVKGCVEPILASGGTVIAGLLCLLLSDLKSNSALGPVAAIGIIVAMLAALTFLPAVLSFLGRAAYWPRRPKLGEPADEGHSLWGRIARFVRSHPRPIWLITVAALAIGCLGIGQLQAEGVARSDLVIRDSEARTGQQKLGEHFPGGSGSPVLILAPADQLQPIADIVSNQPLIDGVSVTTADSPSGSAPVTPDGITPVGPPGTPTPEPTVVDDSVLLQGTLTVAADSTEAEDAVRQLRAALPEGAAVGGVTATAIDTNDASVHDRNLIIPIVLVVILLILMVLLRAVVAPILLIATTALSFGTAMGVAALVFNHLFQFPGADPAVPLYGFVFLVALGIDYNIFLMTRVREERLKHSNSDAVERGLTITGGVITSAGLVLAATFAALAVLPILFLVQLAFIVAFGVLLDTFIVRTLLVPALATDIGPAIWWPSKLAKPDAEPELTAQ